MFVKLYRYKMYTLLSIVLSYSSWEILKDWHDEIAYIVTNSSHSEPPYDYYHLSSNCKSKIHFSSSFICCKRVLKSTHESTSSIFFVAFLIAICSTIIVLNNGEFAKYLLCFINDE